MRFQRILVPTDFSDDARKALRDAVSLAAEFGASITLLHVGITESAYVGWSITGENLALVQRMTEQLVEEQREHLQTWIAEEVPEAMTCTIALRSGYAPDEIIAEVAEGGHDLVVMGSHGRTGLKRMLLGSVTERVLPRCHVPVLVV